MFIISQLMWLRRIKPLISILKMQVPIHWIRPDGTPVPNKQEIAEFCNSNFNMNLTVPQIAKMGRNAEIIQEPRSPQRIEIYVDHKETEIDPDSGLEQAVYIRLSRYI